MLNVVFNLSLDESTEMEIDQHDIEMTKKEIQMKEEEAEMKMKEEETEQGIGKELNRNLLDASSESPRGLLALCRNLCGALGIFVGDLVVEIHSFNMLPQIKRNKTV